MKTICEILKLALSALMFIVAALAICVIFGEEAPGTHFTFLEFFGYKAAAGLILYLQYKFFLFRGRHGLLPFVEVDSYRDLISEEDERA